MESFILELFNSPWLKYVVVLSLLPRLSTRLYKGDVSVAVYNERVVEINTMLKERMCGEQFCKLWKHERLTNISQLYAQDGVHFLQQKPYYKSVRGVVLYGLRSCKTSLVG